MKFEFWWGVSSFFCGVGGIKFEFWWGFYFSTRHLNFTLNRYSVPSGFRRDLHNEAEGRVYGWDGTEYQKCPSMFFILCGYIDKVYTYLYR